MSVFIEEELFNRITGDPTVSGLVGLRVFPVVLPDKVNMPAVTVNRIGTQRIPVLVSGTLGLARASMQISVFSDDYEETMLVASGIRDALDGTESTIIENQLDLYDREARLHYTNLDFSVWYEEKDTI